MRKSKRASDQLIPRTTQKRKKEEKKKRVENQAQATDRESEIIRFHNHHVWLDIFVLLYLLVEVKQEKRREVSKKKKKKERPHG
jgi:hypothetical protein